MKQKIDYVERVFEFFFKGGFEEKYEELGCPEDDLESWYRNAQVYERLTKLKPVSVTAQDSLRVLIEAIRFEAKYPPPPGVPYEFDTSAYEFSEDLICNYKSKVINEVLKQENIPF